MLKGKQWVAVSVLATIVVTSVVILERRGSASKAADAARQRNEEANLARWMELELRAKPMPLLRKDLAEQQPGGSAFAAVRPLSPAEAAELGSLRKAHGQPVK